MEIRKINDTTIRCIITQQDLKDHEIDLDDFIEHKPRAMSYLQSIMEEAAEKEHFRADGPFTSMQVRVLKDQSICLTLTQGLQPDLLNALRGLAAKLSEMSDEEGSGEKLKEEQGLEDLPVVPLQDAPSGDSTEEGTDHYTYAFVYERMKDVIDGCRKVPELAQQETSLFYDKEERLYYLIVLPSGEEADYEKALLSMNEFGDFVELTAGESGYIREHARCILKEKAAQRLLSV